MKEMKEHKPVIWLPVRNGIDLEDLASQLLKNRPYTAFTKGRHDKRGKPICFLGDCSGDSSLVMPHMAIRFNDEALCTQGMEIVRKCKAP